MALLYTKLIFVLLVIWQKSQLSHAAGSSYPCQVTWKNYLAGDKLDETAIASQDGKYYVARKSFFGYSGGWMEKASLKANFEIGDGHTYFEILTNPNDCAFSWEMANFGEIPEDELKFAVRLGSGYVGRGKVPTLKGEYLSGEIRDKDGQNFLFLRHQGSTYEIMGAQFLRTSMNLKLQMQEFRFGETPGKGSEDFLGFDLIINDSESEITHTVTHKKTVKNSYSFTESRSFSETSTFHVSVDIPIPYYDSHIHFDFNKTNWNANSETSELLQEEENEVISQRIIHVPPHSSVQACSIVTMETDFEMPYWSPSKYSIQGYTANQVKQVLRESNYEDKDILGVDGHSVIVNITGALKVTMPMRTTFIVLPQDSPDGCRDLEARISERNRAIKFGKASTSEIKLMEKEIHRIIYNMK